MCTQKKSSLCLRVVRKKPRKDLLGGSVRLLRVIALLAAWNAVAARRPPAARNRHDVVERQVLRADIPMAVMADALRNERAPPVGLAKLARLFALAPHMRRIGIQVKPVFHASLNRRLLALCERFVVL